MFTKQQNVIPKRRLYLIYIAEKKEKLVKSLQNGSLLNSFGNKL